MTATEAPRHADDDLRAQVARARESAATLETEITRAQEKGIAAAEAGDLEMEVKAHSRLAALESALGDARQREERLNTELAVLEAAEAEEQALRRITDQLRRLKGMEAEFAKGVEQVHTQLVRGLGTVATARLQMAATLDACSAEIQRLGGDLLAPRGAKTERAFELVSKLEGERGVDAWALRAIANRNFHPRGAPSLEPYGPMVYQLIDAEIRRRILEAHQEQQSPS